MQRAATCRLTHFSCAAHSFRRDWDHRLRQSGDYNKPTNRDIVISRCRHVRDGSARLGRQHNVMSYECVLRNQAKYVSTGNVTANLQCVTHINNNNNNNTFGFRLTPGQSWFSTENFCLQEICPLEFTYTVHRWLDSALRRLYSTWKAYAIEIALCLADISISIVFHRGQNIRFSITIR